MTRRWLLALLLVAALVAGACSKPGDDDDIGLGGPDDTMTADGNGDGATPGENGPSTTAKNGGTATTVKNGGTATTGKNGGATPTSSGGATNASLGDRGGAGAFARTVLRPQPAAKIVLEVMQEAGAAPVQNTIDHLTRTLRDVTGKQVSVVGPTEVPGGGSNVSEAEIESMSDRFAKAQQGNGQAVIRVLFLKGAYDGDDSVLGIAVRGDTFAVMAEQVRSASSPLATRSEIEDAVSMHELGHLLGLVDIVLKTGRQDPEHEGHSRNRNSVMFWAVESDLVSQVLGGPPPVEFDGADRADLAAIRNGA